MIRGSLSLLLLVFWIATSSAGQTLVINVTGDEPLNTADHKGFLDLVGLEMFRRIGRKVDLVRLPAERALINVNAGLQDGEMSRIKGLEKKYPNLIRVPETVMTWEFVAFSKNNIRPIKSWVSLKGYTVGIINGWKILEANVPMDVEVIKVRDAGRLFNLLFRKRVDVIIYEKWAGLSKLKKTGKDKGRNRFIMHKPALVKRLMYVYLNKKHDKLIAPLEKALQKLKADGSYQAFYRKTLAHIGND